MPEKGRLCRTCCRLQIMRHKSCPKRIHTSWQQLVSTIFNADTEPASQQSTAS